VNIHPSHFPLTTIQHTTINSNTYTGHSIRVFDSKLQNNANVILDAECTTEIIGPFTVPLGATLEIR